jgi:uncharacterized protein
MPLQLSAVEARVLGCLLEKERTTPEVYPLTLNSLTTACNQSTNRYPIAGYDDRTVEAGLDSLREKKLAMIVHGAGARVPKYRHNLLGLFNLDAREVALICVLLLRGAQTPGELRGRTDRLCGESSLSEIESALDQLATGEDPFIRALPARPGQKEQRYIQLFTPEPADLPIVSASAPDIIPTASRIESLEANLRLLRSEFDDLREEFSKFKKQFE